MMDTVSSDEYDDEADCCCYNMGRHKSSFTVAAALHPWEAIRMNCTNNGNELGFPEWLPKRAKPTAVLKEAIHGSVPRKRRLLLIGFESPDGARGVLRLVRSQKLGPFVQCDEILIQRIAMELRRSLAAWSKAAMSEKESDHPTYQIIAQPSQRTRRPRWI